MPKAGRVAVFWGFPTTEDGLGTTRSGPSRRYRPRCRTRSELGQTRSGNASDALLAAIVDSSDDAIVSKSLDGIVTSWNRGAERLFGYSREEMIGSPIAVLAAPDRPHEMSEILERIRCGERIEHYETVRRRKDGLL